MAWYVSGAWPFHGEFGSDDASGLSDPNDRLVVYTDDVSANTAAEAARFASASGFNLAPTLTLTGAGVPAAFTLTAADRYVVTDLLVIAGSALTVTVWAGSAVPGSSPGAGELIFRGALAANGGVSMRLVTPHICTTAKAVRVKTSGAGRVDVMARGLILRLAGG